MSARELPGRAEQLACIEDLALEAVRVLGSGRAARVDPDALKNLAGAALALNADSVTVYRASADAAASDAELLDDAQDLEISVGSRLQGVTELTQEAQRELERAQAAERQARADLSRAKAMPVKRDCDGCHDARAAAITAAQQAIDAALTDQSCCEEALQTLGEADTKLTRAVLCLRRVAGDLETIYEQVYTWLTARNRSDSRPSARQLPKDGDFLQGDDPAGPAWSAAVQRAHGVERGAPR